MTIGISRLQSASLEKVCAMITKFHTVIGDNCPHKSAGYNVASCLRSSAKCNYILDKSDA